MIYITKGKFVYKHEYTSDGQVYKFVDNVNEKTTIYKYDSNKRFIGFAEYAHGENYNYYVAEVGRFISPDNVAVLTATPDALTDKNLYAYCDNNPVMRADLGGEFWNYIISGVVGAIVGGITAALNGEDVAGIITSSVAGAASGLVAASGLGLIAQASVSASISVVSDFANQTVDIVQKDGNIIADYNISQTVSLWNIAR